jgi:hypothetical protein
MEIPESPGAASPSPIADPESPPRRPHEGRDPRCWNPRVLLAAARTVPPPPRSAFCSLHDAMMAARWSRKKKTTAAPDRFHRELGKGRDPLANIALE